MFYGTHTEQVLNLTVGTEPESLQIKSCILCVYVVHRSSITRLWHHNEFDWTLDLRHKSIYV